MTFRILARALAALVAGSAALSMAGAPACSSTPGKTCNAYVVPPGTDFTTPTHFKSDVMPILRESCSFSSCHGGLHGGNQGSLFLGVASGDPNAGPDVEAVYKGIVGVATQELPTMSFVAPGDYSNSYLMHKIDGDACTLDLQCVDQSCGDTMPQSSGGVTIDVASRDTIRRWIELGAKDD